MPCRKVWAPVGLCRGFGTPGEPLAHSVTAATQAVAVTLARLPLGPGNPQTVQFGRFAKIIWPSTCPNPSESKNYRKLLWLNPKNASDGVVHLGEANGTLSQGAAKKPAEQPATSPSCCDVLPASSRTWCPSLSSSKAGCG